MSLLALLALTAAGAATAAAVQKRPFIERFASPAAGGIKVPLSEAVRMGDALYLSGQLGVVPGTRNLVPGGIEAETRQTLDNIKRVLESHGSSMDRVVKCTVFLADIADWQKMNEVYVTYFASALPARSTVGVGGLAVGAKIEIECIAAAAAQ